MKRFRTFLDWKSHDRPTPRDLAFAGFSYSLSTKTTTCEECGISLGEDTWKDNELHPLDVHRRWSSSCPFLEKYQDPRNYTDHIPDLVKHMRPGHSQYCSEIARMASFQDTWWGPNFEFPKRKAEAGFFNLGSKDGVGSITCFHCGIAVFELLPVDDPWEVHTQYSPNCVFVRVRKSLRYIKDVLLKFYRSELCWSMLLEEVYELASQVKHRRAILRLLRREDINLSHPRNVLAMVTSVLSSDEPMCTELFSQVHDWQPLGARPLVKRGNHVIDGLYQSAPEAITTLPDTPRCTLCKTATANIVHLPCGHCISCFECSVLKLTCSVCNSPIDYISRVYFA